MLGERCGCAVTQNSGKARLTYGSLMLASELPRWLSCFPTKLAQYANDPHFCAGWQALRAMDCDGTFPIELLWRMGSVLFKPDSILTRNATEGLRLLNENHASVRAIRILHFEPGLVRQFWQYSLGRLSDERIGVLGSLMMQTPSVYVLASIPESKDRIPGALQLTELKGDALPAKRKAHQLRCAMGPPQSVLFNFVHTADEPADVIRELGLLFSGANLRNLLLEARVGCDDALAHATITRVMEACPSSTLDLQTAVNHVRSSLSETGETSAAGVTMSAALAALDDVASGVRGSWSKAEALLALLGVTASELDCMIISGWDAPGQRHTRSEAFPSCEKRHWSSRISQG